MGKQTQDANLLRIRWVKSAIGYSKKQKETIRALGFRKLNQVVELHKTPEVEGMIERVQHLVEVEKIGA